MPALERRQQIHRWKQEVLAHYVDDHQLQGFALDGDNAFFVANQLLVPGRRRVRCPLPAGALRGPTEPSGTFRLTRPGLGSPTGDRGRDVRLRRLRHPRPRSGPRRQRGRAGRRAGVSSTRVRWRRTTSSPGCSAGWAGPTAIPSRRPPRCRRSRHPLPEGGAGITVAVIDTGWPSRMPPNLDWFRDGTDHEPAPGEVDESGHPLRHIDHLDDDRDGYLDVEAGHGLFVAGLDPPHGAAGPAGVPQGAQQRRRGHRARRGQGDPGRHRPEGRRHQPVARLLHGARRHAVRRRGRGGRRRRCRHPVVAAAGNDAVSSPAYPALLPGGDRRGRARPRTAPRSPTSPTTARG